MDFGEPAIPTVEELARIQKEKRIGVNRAILNNQYKANMAEEPFAAIIGEGYDAQETEFGYSMPTDSTIISDPNYSDKRLSYHTSYRNIAGAEIKMETNLLENISLIEERTGRTAREVINEIIARNQMWQGDKDFRVITQQMNHNSFILAQRIPKYTESELKEFEIFASIITIADSTFVDTSVQNQRGQEIINLIATQLQKPIDFDSTQEAYHSSIKEDRDVFEKYY